MALVAGPAVATAGAPSGALVSGLGVKGAHVKAASGGNLIDHGGKVLPGSNTYALWWGPSAAWSSDVQSGIGTFFSGLSGSSFLNTATQYMRGAGVSSTYKGAAFDASTPPRKISPSVLGKEIAAVYGNALDPSGVYFVFTSNFPRGGNFCAWHSYASVNGQSIAVAYMPNTTGVAGCDPGNLYGVSGSEGLRSLVNVTSHEFMEAITDTLPANATYGWIDAGGAEIGDKCAWTFGGPVTLKNGSVWQLQQEWSNTVSGCVQTT
ncbi:MAG TPA: hypothetical protein VGZ03_09115 [Acidimicrobiales bacterium]|jgi:hypothetical protein|nr:hypothetical protein [Acidimicrobiales bacterium]